YAYLKYTGTGGAYGRRVVVARIETKDGGATFDPATIKELIAYDEPEHNHHGGPARFGPDGMLYIPFGDGILNPPKGQDRSQDLGTIRGKMLRIDVDHGDPYAIPADNPFVATKGARGEIWARGFRNPYEWSFDDDGTLWLGDVGADSREEVDRVVKGGNYGWRIREGTMCVYPPDCGSSDLVDPVYEYSHDEGFAIVGGRIYRGKKLPWLVGRYVFGDVMTGQIWALYTDPTTHRTTREQIATTNSILTQIAEDADRELVAVTPGRGPLKLVANTEPPRDAPRLLSQTGCVDMQHPRLAAPGLAPYDVAMQLWSDGADKARFIALPQRSAVKLHQYTPTAVDFELPKGAIVVKTFFLEGRPIETRLLVNHDPEGFRGYSYEWNDRATEATLLDDLKKKRIGNVDWHYPSRAQCFACHTGAADRVLGFLVPQLNNQMSYRDGHVRNQLDELDARGFFATSPPAPYTLPAFVDRDDTRADDGAWARAYLHANCSHCHRPGGGGAGGANLHAGAPLDNNLCMFEGKIDGENMHWVEPGKPDKSLIVRRMDRDDGSRMPPIGTSIRDALAIKRIRAWI
ncbi:MAG: PQQ-dependent sugar dehydrogenase, partial [Phycisphaerales bacterium]|nr:PQQ-dependent sugar dehydrogenase [Phycisphaerales bacterium]